MWREPLAVLAIPAAGLLLPVPPAQAARVAATQKAPSCAGPTSGRHLARIGLDPRCPLLTVTPPAL
ncbi:hypothetical protein ACFYUK_17955 [Nonomuraea wenchangensis]